MHDWETKIVFSLKTDAHAGKEKSEMKDIVPDFKEDEDDETG